MSMDNIEAIDSLKALYNLSIRIEEFTNTLRSYDMIDIFPIPNDFTYNTTEDVYVPSTGATPINLIRHYRDASSSLVNRDSDWTTNFGDDNDVQDLFWSASKILNRYDKELKEKIEESTISFSRQHRTGPIYFKLMLDFFSLVPL